MLAQSTDHKEIYVEDIDFTIVIDEHGVQVIDHPVCLKKDHDTIDEYLLPSPSCTHKDTEIHWIDPSTANTLCKGTIGAVFGGGTGKLLARIVGGESVARLLEIAGVSEISGHSSGEIICQKLLEEGFSPESNLLDWILEADSIEDLDTENLWERFYDSISSFSYTVLSVGTRGIAVALFVKVGLGIQNPVLAFVISTPIRQVFNMLWAYGVETIDFSLPDYETVLSSFSNMLVSDTSDNSEYIDYVYEDDDSFIFDH